MRSVLPFLLLGSVAAAQAPPSITQGRPPQPLTQWWAGAINTTHLHCDLVQSGGLCNLSVRHPVTGVYLPVTAATRASNGVCDHSALNEVVCRGAWTGDPLPAPVQLNGSFPRLVDGSYQMQQGQILRLVNGPGRQLAATSQGFRADSGIHRASGPLVEFSVSTTWDDTAVATRTRIARTGVSPAWTCSSYNLAWATYDNRAVESLLIDGVTYTVSALPINQHQNFALATPAYDLQLKNGMSLRVAVTGLTRQGPTGAEEEVGGPYAIKFWNDGQRTPVTIIRDYLPLTIQSPITVSSTLSVLP